MIARLLDWFAIFIIEHEWSASLLLSFDDFDSCAAEWTNADTGLCVTQSCNAALQIAFIPAEIFGL